MLGSGRGARTAIRSGTEKFYCIALNCSARLMANPVTATWLGDTTMLLQEILLRLRRAVAATR
jgi:hypothetical protein